MNCQAVTAALPGFVGGDLLPGTSASVRAHLDACPTCTTELTRHERVRDGMQVMRTVTLDPPEGLVEQVIDRIEAPRSRRFVPVPPVPPAELVRVVGENRELLASAAGAAALGVGAAVVAWRLLQRRSPGSAPS